MNNEFEGVGSQVYVIMNPGEEDEHLVEVTLNGTTEIVHECKEGFPMSFTVELPSSLVSPTFHVVHSKVNGCRHYVKKITSKDGEKLVRKWCLQEKKNMFKRKR